VKWGPTTMHILLAEDDLRLGRLVKQLLEREAMNVEWVTRGDLALEYALYSTFDVIILDWLMPERTGLDVCHQLRKQDYQGAILMLTAKDTVEDRVLGLYSGADDYLVKPFEFAELKARIWALSRRSPYYLNEDIVETDGLVLNRTTRVVTRNNKEIQLSGREFQMLDLLVRNRGQIVPREVILDRVWGLESEVTSNNLDAYVRLLRKKISSPDKEGLIRTVRGVGYRLGD
jgi:DNA-binding response OmpR family regulator